MHYACSQRIGFGNTAIWKSGGRKQSKRRSPYCGEQPPPCPGVIPAPPHKAPQRGTTCRPPPTPAQENIKRNYIHLKNETKRERQRSPGAARLSAPRPGVRLRGTGGTGGRGGGRGPRGEAGPARRPDSPAGESGAGAAGAAGGRPRRPAAPPGPAERGCGEREPPGPAAHTHAHTHGPGEGARPGCPYLCAARAALPARRRLQGVPGGARSAALRPPGRGGCEGRGAGPARRGGGRAAAPEPPPGPRPCGGAAALRSGDRWPRRGARRGTGGPGLCSPAAGASPCRHPRCSPSGSGLPAGPLTASPERSPLLPASPAFPHIYSVIGSHASRSSSADTLRYGGDNVGSPPASISSGATVPLLCHPAWKPQPGFGLLPCGLILSSPATFPHQQPRSPGSPSPLKSNPFCPASPLPPPPSRILQMSF